MIRGAAYTPTNPMSSRALLLAVLTSVGMSSARAQCAQPAKYPTVSLPLFVNDEAEVLARIRQDVGDAPAYPWTMRAFSWRESCAIAAPDSTDAWRYVVTGSVRRMGAIRVAALPLSLNLVGNSSFPFGHNDGAVWAGRGLTTSLNGGFAIASRFVTVVVAPVMFRAENTPFTIAANGYSGAYAFGDAFSAGGIDQPQRFGSGAYQRLSPGNSSVRLEAAGVALGFSTETQHWGPARENPLVLGNNAEGYPHVYAGTARPVRVGLGTLQARMHWGRLQSSPYSVARDDGGYRFASGLGMAFTPKGFEGLEIGFGRFFHLRWSDTVLTLANFARPFIGLVRKTRVAASGNPLGNEPDNQLASVFARWVFPRAGFEFYGEIGKDDYNSDFRELVMEPDHFAAYMLGFQRVVRRGRDGYVVFRGEMLNSRITSIQLNRPEGPLYLHSPLFEGHTYLGQVLGAAAGNGGGAASLAADRYSRHGRTTVSWSRMLRQEFRNADSGLPEANRADLLQVLSFSGLRLRGRTAITYEVTGVYEFNRDFRTDARNVRVALGVRQAW
jgi:hypothetical protein